MKGLLYYTKPSNLHSYEDATELSCRFESYFIEKVEKIRNKLLAENSTGSNPHEYDVPSKAILETFTSSNLEEIIKLIKQSPNKQSIADPIPTWLLKKCVEPLAPYLLHIINTSIETGVVPNTFKEAVVTPLIKKPSLDPENLKNYRPVSNLCFMSKLLEKVVANHIYLTEHKWYLLKEPFHKRQSQL